MTKPEGPVCQSCGMPLNMDPQGGGTERDGSKNDKYCSHCYQNGEFTLPELTVDQMQARVEDKLKEFHLPQPIVKEQVSTIPNLDRWSADEEG